MEDVFVTACRKLWPGNRWGVLHLAGREGNYLMDQAADSTPSPVTSYSTGKPGSRFTNRCWEWERGGAAGGPECFGGDSSRLGLAHHCDVLTWINKFEFLYQEPLYCVLFELVQFKTSCNIWSPTYNVLLQTSLANRIKWTRLDGKRILFQCIQFQYQY